MQSYIENTDNPLFKVRDVTNLLQSIRKPHSEIFNPSIEKILWFCINQEILSSHLSGPDFKV